MCHFDLMAGGILYFKRQQLREDRIAGNLQKVIGGYFILLVIWAPIEDSITRIDITTHIHFQQILQYHSWKTIQTKKEKNR